MRVAKRWCFSAALTEPSSAGKAADPLVTDLQCLHPTGDGRFEALPAGEFTLVKRVASGIHGDVFKYRWAWAVQDGGHVAVKKLRHEACVPCASAERNERRVHFRVGRGRAPCQEDALTEIGVLGYLSKQTDVPQYLLRMLGVFADANHAWLVTEFCEGGELFEEVSRRGRLDEAHARRHSWEILQAVRYLHRHSIAHRDLSLENILLKGGSVRVMDFGMSVRSHLPCGTELRYFGAVGKDFYRAPECYVPEAEFIDVVAPLGAAPGAVTFIKDRGHLPYEPARLGEVRLPADARPGQRCRAQVWGYAAQPADAFAVGACMFIMLNGSPPWGRAHFSDAVYSYVDKHGLPALLRDWGMQAMTPAIEEVVLGLTCADPSRRLSMQACLDCPWFADFSRTEVPRHSAPALASNPLMRRAVAGA